MNMVCYWFIVGVIIRKCLKWYITSCFRCLFLVRLLCKFEKSAGNQRQTKLQVYTGFYHLFVFIVSLLVHNV